jgi:hypothetical protein
VTVDYNRSQATETEQRDTPRATRAVGSLEFYRFCDILTAGGASTSIGPLRIPSAVLNYAGYVKEHVVSRCPPDKNGKRDVEDVSRPHFPFLGHVRELIKSVLQVLWDFRPGQVCTGRKRSEVEALAVASLYTVSRDDLLCPLPLIHPLHTAPLADGVTLCPLRRPANGSCRNCEFTRAPILPSRLTYPPQSHVGVLVQNL